MGIINGVTIAVVALLTILVFTLVLSKPTKKYFRPAIVYPPHLTQTILIQKGINIVPQPAEVSARKITSPAEETAQA